MKAYIHGVRHDPAAGLLMAFITFKDIWKLGAMRMERKLDKTESMRRRLCRVGGGAPVSIQSMLNTRTTDVEACLAQIRALAAAGCEIARLAVPDHGGGRDASEPSALASPLPLVADIHFDYRLAIRAAENGAAKIRINPGNIGGEERVRAVVEACGARNIPHSHRRERRQS